MASLKSLLGPVSTTSTTQTVLQKGFFKDRSCKRSYKCVANVFKRMPFVPWPAAPPLRLLMAIDAEAPSTKVGAILFLHLLMYSVQIVK